jgi:hypothetical protein
VDAGALGLTAFQGSLLDMTDYPQDHYQRSVETL